MSTTHDKIKQMNKCFEEAHRLQEEIQQTQDRCRHEWEDSIYDPDSVLEFYFTHLETQGSDCWPAGNYSSKDVPRWSRTCKHCGKKEYTKKRKVVETEPDFRR